MDYSPHRQAGGIVHLRSQSHAHHIDGFTVPNLRRSLSRSPSKPQRYQYYTHTPTKTAATMPPSDHDNPLLPPKSSSQHQLTYSSYPTTFTTTPAPVKKKFTLRRSLKSSRTAMTSRSPMRRALGEASHHVNITPAFSKQISGEENQSSSESRDSSSSITSHKPPTFSFSTYHSIPRFDSPTWQTDDLMQAQLKLQPHTDTPTQTEAHTETHTNTQDLSLDDPLAPSVPPKRMEGSQDMGQAEFTTPVKRRSLHSASLVLGSDVFDRAPTPTSGPVCQPQAHNPTMERTLRHQLYTLDMPSNSFPSPAAKRCLSFKRPLRQQYHHTSRGRFADASHEALTCTQESPLLKSRYRAPSNASAPTQTSHQPASRSMAPSPSYRVYIKPQPQPQAQPSRSTAQANSCSSHQPHPLSQSVSPWASGLDGVEDGQAQPEHPSYMTRLAQVDQSLPASPRNRMFSKSLPIGALRPVGKGQSSSSADSFATPAALKSVQHPGGFMSTGLISKRNRNPDFHPYNDTDRYAMPDTPSKRASFPPVRTNAIGRCIEFQACTPLQDSMSPVVNHTHSPNHNQSQHQNQNRTALDLFTKFSSSRLFGSSNLARRTSFVSEDGDDRHKEQQEGQSSADELPPTPTKVNGSGRIKPTSLRSSLFGRRTSLGPDTFAPLSSTETKETVPLVVGRRATPVPDKSGRSSPITPQSFTPPDAGRLSFPAFRNTTSGTPATPTTQRDHPFANIPAVKRDDLDTSITARFSLVSTIAQGEFSVVYRVENPLRTAFLDSRPPHPTKAWVIKKSKRQYLGPRNRLRKLREVEILRSLKGHDHILEYLDHWEYDKHLYIQTEYCENGTLAKFLAETGNKARLDDFRIWKILLEMCMGLKAIHDSGFMHLDLKPANIFISFQGMLKIGDFGLASEWPASKDIDGEGDREYISPEILSGRFDRPADVFALGLITLEIAGNFFLPDNGDQWQRLRSGNLTDIPSLTWSCDSQLSRDENGDPVDSDSNSSILPSSSPRSAVCPNLGHAQPPCFMFDRKHPDSLDLIVHWMLRPGPDERPSINQVIDSPGLQWVARRRRAGATVFEGNWGPGDHVLGTLLHQPFHSDLDVEMADV